MGTQKMRLAILYQGKPLFESVHHKSYSPKVEKEKVQKGLYKKCATLPGETII